MPEKIQVLIVDDIPETRENVRKLLQFEPDLEVIGHAGTGEEAIKLAEAHRPHIILMDINMPDADGIAASQIITKRVPSSQVIIMSVQSEADYLRRAMLAGARDFLMKPFSGDELVEAVRRVHAARPRTLVPANNQFRSATQQAVADSTAKEGKIIAVFSPKGGNGCSTIAANVAIGLAEREYRTLLIDGSLQFGDIGLLLNIKSMASIADLVDHMHELDPELVSSVVALHESGLRVLLAPPRPEMAELVKAEHMTSLLEFLRRLYDFLVIDTSSSLNDVSIAMLDAADRVVLVARQNLPSLKNISRFFDLSQELEYEQSKVSLIVNFNSKSDTISVKDIETTLKWPISIVIPEDEAAIAAVDQGRPLVSASWRRRPAARALDRLTSQLINELDETDKISEDTPRAEVSRLSRLLGR